MQSPQVTNGGVCTGSTAFKGEGSGSGKSSVGFYDRAIDFLALA
jgi:hypothetical protein